MFGFKRKNKPTAPMRGITPVGRSGSGEAQLAPLQNLALGAAGQQSPRALPAQVGSVAAGAATALTAPPVELELAPLTDGAVNVKILVDEIIEVAKNNNEKSNVLSQIIDKILKDFKAKIDGLQKHASEADQAATAAAAATEALRIEKDGLDANKQAEIASLSADLKSNMDLVTRGKQEAAQKTLEYKTELSLLQGKCDKLTGLCEGKDKYLHEEAEKITQLGHDLNRMTAVGQEREEEIAAIRAALDQAISNHKRELDGLTASLNAASVESGAKQEELNIAAAAALKLKGRLEELSKANNLTREENEKMRSENEQLFAKIGAVDAKVAQLERNAAEADSAAALAQQEVGIEKAKCNQMAAEMEKLRTALATMKDSGVKLGEISGKIGKDPNANASNDTKELLARMDALNKRLKGASGGGRKKTRKKKNKKKRNSTKRIVFKTKKQNKKTRIKKVKKVNRRPAKKLTRKRM